MRLGGRFEKIISRRRDEPRIDAQRQLACPGAMSLTVQLVGFFVADDSGTCQSAGDRFAVGIDVDSPGG